MSTIAVKPFVLKDVLLSVATDNYEAHVSQVQFDPSSSIQVWQGLTPTSVHTDVTTATWQAVLAYAQDWETPNSLSRYLYDHEGQEVPVVFKPRSGSGPSFSATLVITPGSIGGTFNSFATGSVTLGVKGKPQIVNSQVQDNQWAIAVTGTPTGGSYVLTFNGAATAPIAYNAATSAVTGAINALSGVTGITGVTVSGTASAYTLVFPTNVTMVATHTLTGGTTPTVTATAV